MFYPPTQAQFYGQPYEDQEKKEQQPKIALQFKKMETNALVIFQPFHTAPTFCQLFEDHIMEFVRRSGNLRVGKDQNKVGWLE